MNNISKLNIRRIDLNLLVVLDALLSEANVTRAAQQLHLAQPTVSNALARLRVHFGDPLLVRKGRSMHPTPRARKLMVPIRDALNGINRALDEETTFNPVTTERTFRIATTDYVSLVLLAPLLARLAHEAPHARVAISELAPDNPLEALRSGEIDFILGSIAPGRPSIHNEQLFTDHYVCLARNDHSMVRRRLSLRQFTDTAHISIRHQHGGPGGLIDELLAQRGLQRRVSLSLPHFVSAPFALLSSDLLLTAGARLGRMLQRNFPLQILKHPLPLRPFVVSQLWHQRDDVDRGHLWMRNVLTQLGKDLEAIRR